LLAVFITNSKETSVRYFRPLDKSWLGFEAFKMDSSRALAEHKKTSVGSWSIFFEGMEKGYI
jgi:hypothetical protein